MRDRDTTDESRADEESQHFTAISPDLAPDKVARALAQASPDATFGALYEPHGMCGSTNDLCAQRARQGAPEGLVVLADQQTGGKGRLGRRWLSEPGQNLTFSLLLRPACAVTALPPLTLLTGVVLADVLEKIGVKPRLKWPNDVLVDTPAGPRKLAGVLTEMATQRDEVKHVVLGIGINVNQIRFDAEVTDTATSLRALTNQTLDRAQLLADILSGLEALYTGTLRLGAGAFMPTWRKYAQLPRPCVVQRSGDELRGDAVGVDEDGALLIKNAEGVHRVLSGDVTPL